MDETNLQALERFVVENDDLLSLEEQIGRFNIFEALRIARVEIRHSNFLEWLLTPGGSHSRGDSFLRALLMDMLRKARHQGLTPPMSPVELDGADLSGVQIRREWRNIDLLITCEQPRFVVAIENKIDSGEHSNQLQRYEDTIAAAFPRVKRMLVYLTPEGDEASDEDWVDYSYQDVHRVFTRTRDKNAGAIGDDVLMFLNHYLGLIGNRFMENEEIDRLCRQIYFNHRQALDLIWERVGTPASGLVGRIEKWIKDHPDQWLHITTKQREVEFIPKAWSAMLPAVGKRKTFDPKQWITIRLRVGSSRLRIFVTVCPTTDLAIRKQVVERLLRNKKEFGFSSFFKKKELTDDWTRIRSDEVASLPEDEEPDLDAVMEQVEKYLSNLLKDTEGVPAAMRSLFGK